MLKFMRTGSAPVLLLMLGLLAGHVHAQEVTLRSVDGDLEMTGRLEAFDGSHFRLATSFGTVELAADSVTCDGEACPDLLADVTDFIVAGSSTIGTELMPALIESYAYDIGGDLEVERIAEDRVVYRIIDAQGALYAAITLGTGRSDLAFSALETGDASIGISSRRPTAEERNRLLQLGKGDLTSAAQEHVLGLDGLAVVVNPDNPIRALAIDEISDIFAGNIRNWRALGGPDARINVYRGDAQTGATQMFNTLVMAPTRRSLTATAFIKPDGNSVSTSVEDDRYGIGLTNMVDMQNTKPLSLVSVCGQVSSLSEFLIKTEEYPLSRRMFAYANSGNMPAKAAEFLAYITSDEAQSVVEQAGYVSQSVDVASLNDQGRRLAHALLAERDLTSLTRLQDMVTSLQDAEQLSLTFRFLTGSVTPDNRAVSGIARLADRVRKGDFNGKQLMIVGFADSSGAISESQRLSQARADSVRDLLVGAVGDENAGNVQFTSIGYGKLFPVGCNETQGGRRANRRVEIWVR